MKIIKSAIEISRGKNEKLTVGTTSLSEIGVCWRYNASSFFN